MYVVVTKALADINMKQANVPSIKVTELQVSGHKTILRSSKFGVFVAATADLGAKGIQVVLHGGDKPIKGDPAADVIAILKAIIPKSDGIAAA